MAKDLTTSQIDRQNILNNDLAVNEIQNQTGIQGILYDGRLRFTKSMVATYFNVEVRTIERYVSDNSDEIMSNGYEVLKGKKLKEFMNCVLEQDVPDINVGNISNRTPQIAIFDFKAFLNMAMLLAESENAKVLRQIMLDIVIDFVNQRTGGSTKYINQRDQDFISAFLQEENYRREFTDALRDYVDMGNSKYAIYTDKIYQSIFKEKAQEYKQILHLSKRDNARDTMYSEVLDLIASYECGLAAMIKEQSEQLGRKLNNWELSDLFTSSDYKVNPCIGCNGCFGREDYSCFQDDDMSKIYEKLKTAEILVIASPVYFYGISAQLKAIVDRLHTPMRNSFGIKKLGLLLVGVATLPNLFDPILLQYPMILNFFKLEDAGGVLVRGVKDKGDAVTAKIVNQWIKWR